MSQQKSARDLALRVLFQIDVGKLPPGEALELMEEAVEPSEAEAAIVRGLIEGTIAELSRLDEIIGSLAEGWKLDRLARVDKNVLRLAIHELDRSPASATSTIINDAVEIAKRYSTEDSGRFVNGILGSYVRRRADLADSAGRADRDEAGGVATI